MSLRFRRRVAVVGKTAAMLLALTAGAHATSNQLKAPEMIGRWCGVEGNEGKTFTYFAISNMYLKPTKKELEDEIEKCGDRILTIKPNEFVEWESGCRFISVNEWKNRREAYDTKNVGAPTADIIAACSGEGCTWKSRITLQWSKGTLRMTSRTIGKEVCNG